MTTYSFSDLLLALSGALKHKSHKVPLTHLHSFLYASKSSAFHTPQVFTECGRDEGDLQSCMCACVQCTACIGMSD